MRAMIGSQIWVKKTALANAIGVHVMLALHQSGAYLRTLPNSTPLEQWLTQFEAIPKYEGQSVVKMYEEAEDDDLGTLLLLPWSAAPAIRELGFEIEDYRVSGRKLELPPSRFIAREGQEEAIAGCVEYLRRHSGGNLIAGCGSGKTVMGSEMVGRLGVATCIVTHKEFLNDQWEDALTSLYPGIRIGKVRQDRCDTGADFDVVLSSTQSLTSPTREYPSELFSSFGALFLDEVHRYSADVWQRVLRMFPCKIRCGFTATAKRPDGLWSVIEAHIGKTAVEMESEPIATTACMVELDTVLDCEKLQLDAPWLSKVMVRARIISALGSHNGRNAFIARNLKKAWTAGRKVLVISERRKQLDLLSKRLIIDGVPKEEIGFYVGGMKNRDERLLQASKKLVMTTYQMAKEGLDIVSLDSLVLATPQSFIEQAVGRILRQCENKKPPLVIDFVDKNIEEVASMAHNRRREYRGMGCDIRES